MFEVLFLGTAASAPSVHRGLAAHVIMVKDYRFLLDCGEGTQRQILRSGIGFRRLNRVLITHGHLDHIYGLGGLLSTLVRWENMDALEIYGGRWALERIHDLIFNIVLRDEHVQHPIDLYELKTGVFFEDKDFTISAFPVTHRGPGCFGFIFQENPKRPFLNEKATALGIPMGPERAKLVRGESITLADGRLIRPDDVLGPDLPGTRYVHIGDVGRTDNIVQYVRDAHALVIESTYLASETEMARQFGHMTAAQAAQLAVEANVKTLILTHISHRSRERDVIAEARAIFPNTYVARDFDRFVISKDKPVERISPSRGHIPTAENDLALEGVDDEET
ncbi:MAG: ribonuclease Z [Anaerolineae bacterium]|nr:ribonuclease Z [Anaerolineae bacterium]